MSKSKHTFIIVSNRLPINVSKVGGKLLFSSSPGGLATAMSSLNIDNDKRLWIGWPGIDADTLTTAEKKQITEKLREFGCVPVFLTAKQVKYFYEGYANDTLWPLFHYFQNFAEFNTDYWAAYRSVNELFRRAINEYAHPKATIWIHDYHLLLLPKLVRESVPDSSIGFFLHIPFPSFEVFRALPERKEILEGLLGADLVGFHTYDFARHFMSSVLRTLGYESQYGKITLDDRVVIADAFPIGIDYHKFTEMLHQPSTLKELDILEKHYQDTQIILSVDRLDYTKGIPHRLKAFEEFLQQHPAYHKKVSLVIVAVPSRTEVPTYKNLRDSIEQTISRINGTYATMDWTPISYRFKHIPFEELVALFAKAAVAIVSPLRDGMNLVAKEYVACKQDSPGVLILSELAGAADELQEALRINPYDTVSMVKAIKTALSMPKSQQQKRLGAMQRRIAQYNVQRWASDFLEQLAHSKHVQDSSQGRLISRAEKGEISNAFKRAKRRWIFLDYDGTLMDFVDTPDPAKAAPSAALLKLLRELAHYPQTQIGIVSGRTREALESWFGDMPLALIAEHGSWIKQEGEWSQELYSFNEQKKRLKPLMERYAERTPGAFIEEKHFALVWHYRNVSPELAYARNASLKHDLNVALAGSDVGIFSGNKIIEVKPYAIQKSTAVSELLDSSPADFILCAGDDYTDEDMFRTLAESAYTIKVGLQESNARFYVGSVEELRSLLRSLLR